MAISRPLSYLENLAPEHDSPVGQIHPYWARKPLNIVQLLVCLFSRKGEIVVDPFVGSGTTVFAALSKGRKAIGADLNPLSIFLTKSILQLLDSPLEKTQAATEFVEELSRQIMPMFQYSDSHLVERERFTVQGEYEDGNFELLPTEVVLKRMQGKALRGRSVEKPVASWMERNATIPLLSNPVDFEALRLLPNSRIAIPSGATLGDFYEKKNQVAINLALRLIASEKYGKENESILRLLLSASLPLLRLSDKKASSQWPYWRPKDHLTSRNPIPILRDKLAAIERAVEWLKANVANQSEGELSTRVELHNEAIQLLIPKHVQPGQADLVLTDPPYSDQAPYLEYSALWIQLMGMKLPLHAYENEIVKTDAPSRVEDTNDYVQRLRDGIRECARLVKPDGYLVWFYQDHNIQHWAALDEEMAGNGLRMLNVVPLPKQRRSMKTVTSPGKTLDGDLILIFKKTLLDSSHRQHYSSVRNLVHSALDSVPASNYFHRYAAVVKIALKFHLFGLLSSSFEDLRELVSSAERWR